MSLFHNFIFTVDHTYRMTNSYSLPKGQNKQPLLPGKVVCEIGTDCMVGDVKSK